MGNPREKTGMEISPRIRWVKSNIAGNRILDIGFAGDTPLVHKEIRSKLPNAFMSGIDIDTSAVLMHKFDNSLVGDAKHLPFADATFNAITLLEVIEHFEKDTFMLIREARRVLTDGGSLYLTTPNPYSWYRWLLHWLVTASPHSPDNYRKFLGAIDHKIFWEPLSLMNILAERGLEVTSITTKNHRIPFLARIFRAFKAVDLPFYPMNRLGGYTCIVAIAV
jgi:SAM-dependent methyltransferase